MIGRALVSALTTTISSTPFGNRRSTPATASRTSLAATSIFTFGANWAQILELSSSLAELISRTPATRATAASITDVTSASMVSGEAPSKKARTLTHGRSTSGNSRTSTPSNALKPATMISRLRTTISVGRRTASEGKSPKRVVTSCRYVLWGQMARS